MAKNGTEKVFGGTAYKRDTDPKVVGTPNQFGLYPWSAFRAGLGFLDKNSKEVTYEGAGSLDDLTVEVLLFTSDIPAISTGVSYKTSTGVSYPSPAENRFISAYILSPTSGGAIGVTGLQYGKVLSGYAGVAQSVYCTGFVNLVTYRAPNGETSTDYSFECLSNGPVISAPVGSNSIINGNTLAPVPLLLNATDYTQAMYDAGNLYTNPTNGYKFQIVGLYKPIVIPG